MNIEHKLINNTPILNKCFSKFSHIKGKTELGGLNSACYSDSISQFPYIERSQIMTYSAV